MASEDFHRDSCKRLHRVIANYLAHQAWLRQLDCIVLERTDLEHFLQIERFKSVRVEWLLEDMKPWFKYQVAYHKSSSPSSIHSLFLSRVPIADELSDETMTTSARIALMSEEAPRTAEFFKQGSKRPTESEIVSQLALLSTGLVVPTVPRSWKRR